MSHKITFREYGHGPLLVLLHGYGGSVTHWDGVVDGLKDRYRVVVPNLSHLYIAKNRLLFSVIVNQVAEFVRSHFPGEKASFAGLSFGGAVAWGLGLQHPELVDRLMLLNPLMPHPVPRFRLPEIRYFFVLPMSDKAMLRLFPTPIGQAFLGRAAMIFRPDRATAERSLSRLSPIKMAFVADLVAHFSWILRSEDWNYWETNLSRVTAPTLVAWSEDDLLFESAVYRDLADALKAQHREALPGGGHVLSQSCPQEVVRLCEAFMAASARPVRKTA